jgi:hypothetical protein
LKSKEAKSCLVSEKVAQDVLLFLSMALFKREEWNHQFAGPLLDGEFGIFHPQ